MYEYVLVCTGLYSYVLVHTSMYYTYFLHINPAGIYRYKLEHARMFILVQCHTALSSSGYKAVQGGTRQSNRYKAVQGSTQKSCTPEQCGTRKYMMVQRPCATLYLTLQLRGTGLLGTALYRLVPPCIQKRTRLYERKPEFTKYASMCIHTGFFRGFTAFFRKTYHIFPQTLQST